MKFSVLIMPEANNDIDGIVTYIATHDFKSRAHDVARKIRAKIKTLKHFPERHGYTLAYLPKDSSPKYRETLSGPYRIFYRIDKQTVYVVAVADGRRDIKAFLTERLQPNPR